MLEKVLYFLRNQVNQYLKLKTGSEDKLVLTRILDKAAGHRSGHDAGQH